MGGTNTKETCLAMDRLNISLIMTHRRSAWAIAVLCAFLDVSDVARAGIITFESPTYQTGPLAGQDGWVGTSFILVSPQLGPNGAGGNTVPNQSVIGTRFNPDATLADAVGRDNTPVIPNNTMQADFRGPRGGANNNFRASTDGSLFDGPGIRFSNNTLAIFRPDNSEFNFGFVEQSWNPTTWYRITLTFDVNAGTAVATVYDLTNDRSPTFGFLNTDPPGTFSDNLYFSYGGYDTPAARQAWLDSFNGVRLRLQQDGFNGATRAEIDNIQTGPSLGNIPPVPVPAPVPEPASVVLWSIVGGVGAVFARRRRAKQPLVEDASK